MVDAPTAEHHGICPECEGYGGRSPDPCAESDSCIGGCPVCRCPGCHDEGTWEAYERLSERTWTIYREPTSERARAATGKEWGRWFVAPPSYPRALLARDGCEIVDVSPTNPDATGQRAGRCPRCGRLPEHPHGIPGDNCGHALHVHRDGCCEKARRAL